jgi:hypothetical protein
MTMTLTAGVVMILAGYAGSAWGWVFAVPLGLLAVVVILGAFVLDRRQTLPDTRSGNEEFR